MAVAMTHVFHNLASENCTIMIYLSREAHFCAAHKLYNPEWSKEKNEEVFGPCANENWHGHNFDLTVTVRGEPDPSTGFVMNFKDLNQIIRTGVLEKVDHKNLNLDVPFLAGKLTSCETIVIEFWRILDPMIRHASNDRAQLHCLRLRETPRNYAEYYGS